MDFAAQFFVATLGHGWRGGLRQRNHFVRRADRSAHFALDVRPRIIGFLLPASLIGGAAFMVAADLIARVAIAPAEIPVGAITALCGGPFFIYMLRREGRRPLSL